jgi:hypothetical protein
MDDGIKHLKEFNCTVGKFKLHKSDSCQRR